MHASIAHQQTGLFLAVVRRYMPLSLPRPSVSKRAIGVNCLHRRRINISYVGLSLSTAPRHAHAHYTYTARGAGNQNVQSINPPMVYDSLIKSHIPSQSAGNRRCNRSNQRCAAHLRDGVGLLVVQLFWKFRCCREERSWEQREKGTESRKQKRMPRHALRCRFSLRSPEHATQSRNPQDSRGVLPNRQALQTFKLQTILGHARGGRRVPVPITFCQ